MGIVLNMINYKRISFTNDMLESMDYKPMKVNMKKYPHKESEMVD